MNSGCAHPPSVTVGKGASSYPGSPDSGFQPPKKGSTWGHKLTPLLPMTSETLAPATLPVRFPLSQRGTQAHRSVWGSH